jgi:fatty acid desaturase
MKSLPKKKQKTPAEKKATAMPLEAFNYLMIALGALVIAGSYWGMYLEKSVDGIFALFISPVTLVGAYVWIIFAVLYRPKPQKTRQG